MNSFSKTLFMSLIWASITLTAAADEQVSLMESFLLKITNPMKENPRKHLLKDGISPWEVTAYAAGIPAAILCCVCSFMCWIER